MTTQSSEWLAAARLVRRTGFGATGPAVDAALRTGTAGYVDAALAADPATDPGAIATPPPSFAAIAPVGKNADRTARQQRNKQISAQVAELTGWWVRRMIAVQQPTVEKLTFDWHNHFATAVSKVRQPAWMLAQNETLRRLGRGGFRPLALAMLTDAAMLRWLDGETNTADAPNENLSREFMELFALGQGDGYTEMDVREGARALTGWRIRRDGQTYLDANKHDDGVETFLGVTGSLDVTGYCDAVLARPSSPAHVAGRWWGQLVSDSPPGGAVLAAVLSAYGPQRDLTALFRAMLTSPAFAAAEGTKVISPVEWLVGVARALRLPASTSATALVGALRGLGQVPFDPPNVGGWPAGQAWLSTASADLRLRTATALARAGDLATVTDAASGDRIDAAGYLLGIGAWSDRSVAALRPSVGDPRQLVAIAANTPEYLVH